MAHVTAIRLYARPRPAILLLCISANCITDKWRSYSCWTFCNLTNGAL